MTHRNGWSLRSSNRRVYKRPNSSCWQCSSYVGLYTLLASARVRATGRVHAFEPLPRNLAYVDDDLGQTILEIEVRGKRGVGYCKCMSGAVRPFQRLKSRLRPPRAVEPGKQGPTKEEPMKEGQGPDNIQGNILKPSEQGHLPASTDLLFPNWQRELFNTILDEENLKTDREGRPRTAYSPRHTYICLRLIEGADIYQIAKNCRTSG